ncbi:hypothetical protein [Chitinophaga qingshengii]|uniref:Uncharacterized protein n=1 Tax=Chitinophaga qingshengii TaxID=1569794 RepID=A0ABR7TK02_9BACT|nr:hypothetical protein [Chitinophaga qingshengii]MBC9930817.1 hypothetical protein [Chitinophaga qingshengii]
MRIGLLIYQYRITIIEAVLLMAALAGLWRVNNWFLSFICGVAAGYLFFRLAERIAQHRIRKA